MPDNARTILVRPVQPEDAEPLRANCYSANTLAQVKERIAQNVQAYEQGTEVHLVAEVDGIVVGTGGLVRKTHPLHAHRGELVSLVVHPDHQRQGIARRIVAELCRYAAPFGITLLEVGCRGGTPAETVYARLGFVECGRLPGGIVEPWGEQRAYDEVSFCMPLDAASADARG
jgi:GNAT superfamily N-acetyltransferase